MSVDDLIQRVSSLGDILLAITTLSPEDLRSALHSQRQGERIGSCLVRLRLVTLADVERAIDLQRRMREHRDMTAADEMLQAARAETAARLYAMRITIGDMKK